MHQVQLSDQAYQEAKRHALEAGFGSVDEYVADVLLSQVGPQAEDLDHLFTPDRLAHIDESAAQIEAGDSYTADQVREHFGKKFGR